MKELAEALRRFTNNENARIIDDLVSLIIDNEVDDMDELKELEDGNFVKGLTLENKANEAYLSMIKDVYKYDNMNSLQIDRLDDLKDFYNNTHNIEDKILYLIKMYDLLHYQLAFPFCAYSLILKSRL
jgi:hypothetical protein